MKKLKVRLKKSLNTIDVRLMVIYVLLLLPVMGAAWWMLIQSSFQVRSVIENETAKSLTFLSAKLENEIDSVLYALDLFAEDPATTAISYQSNLMRPSEYYTNLCRLQKRLNLTRTNLLAKDISIYFNTQNKVLTYNDFKDIDETEYAEMISLLNNVNSLYYFDEAHALNLVRTVPVSTRTDKPVLLVRARISKEELQAYLSRYCTERSNEIALYNQRDKIFIYSYGNQIKNDDFFQLAVAALANQDYHGHSFTVERNPYYLLGKPLRFLDSSIIQAVPMEYLSRQQTVFWLFIIINILMFIIIFFLYRKVIKTLLQRPLKMLLTGFKEIEQGNYDIAVDVPNTSTDFQQLVVGFNHMAATVNNSFNTIYQQELWMRQIELKQLQAQINPHFLYNSYFILSRLIQQEDLETANQLSDYLGSYFKHITRCGSNMVPLSTEWDHARCYLEIQKLRFTPWFSYQMDKLSQAIQNVMVPRLILQPLLENALEHGLTEHKSGSLVKVQHHMQAGFLQIIVEDNGGNITLEKLDALEDMLKHGVADEHEVTALLNIDKRLKLSYGDNCGITLAKTAQAGLQVTLCIGLGVE